MKTSHTPGPWLPDADDMADSDALVIGITSGEENIGSASCFTAEEYEPGIWGAGMRGDIKTARANARLMAAAPDLLAALQSVMADMDSDFGTGFDYEKCRAAIKKATGATP